ncbi:hypothetical protein GTU99_20920 [Streptomyces sp. PRKS01-65]|nr:hypothetical protein [Streptomyces harenosi]NEY34632.1 hypothetical protein [Streptomyces harenosi]
MSTSTRSRPFSPSSSPADPPRPRRITSCTDLDRLDDWLGRALTVERAEELSDVERAEELFDEDGTAG